jgi:hypothetical protein
VKNKEILSKSQGEKTMAKKGITKGTWKMISVLLIALLGLGVFFGVVNFSVSSESSEDATSLTSDGRVLLCGSDTTPDLLIQAYDVDNVGTSISETFAYRKAGTKSWNVGTTGTELTGLEADAQYEIVLGINTTDVVDNAYGEKFTHTVKCQEDETIEKAMYNDEIESSLSATFYNKDGDASSQTYSAGDNYVVSVRLKSGADEYFGNPTVSGNPNVLVLKLNQSEWDTPLEVYTEDGTELKRISTPQRYDQQASGFSEYAYEVPVVADKEIEIFFDLMADGSNAPVGDGTAYIYAGGYYIDDNGQVQVGVEDEDGNAVGTDAPDTVTFDFTA